MRIVIVASVLGLLLVACRAVPPTASGSVPVVYQLDWWPYQSGVAVDTFEVGEPVGALQLLNHTVFVPITLRGHVSAQTGWKPHVSAVHVSEHFEPNAVAEDRHALIEFTPVVTVVQDPAYSGTSETFAVDLSYPLSTWQWERNELQLSCEGILHDLVLEQRK